MDLASAAAAIHGEMDIGPMDMLIRHFAPEDFLFLCRRKQLRDCIIGRTMATAQDFTLALRSWCRDARATEIAMPYRVDLSLGFIPANA